ncbi:hypothetical protein [Bacillus atrophaeus]|uniref:hypothetical protein n=1 Tax=Bacillus atrophaeus TaxID=1452 RepID=UPI002E1CC1ED|nr:hypothetical protein [Bacillus atrophaeus]
MGIIRFVDRDIGEPIDYSYTPMKGTLKYTLKKNLPSSLPRSTFIYTTDTQELYHGSGYGAPLKKVYSEEEARKTVVFYVGIIDSENQEVSLFVPLKGEVRKLYVNLGKKSAEDLAVSVQNAEGELGNIVVKSGNTFAELLLDGYVNFEQLKTVVSGELSLPDISILVDIIPERN